MTSTEMYKNSIRRYCLPCVAALVSQDNIPAVKNSFLEFLAPTFNVEQYAYFPSLLGAFGILRKATISFVMSVCQCVRPSVRPHGTNNSAATERILMKLDI